MSDYPTIGETVLIVAGTFNQRAGIVEVVDADHDKILVYVPSVGYAAPYRATEIQRDGAAREDA